jgi:hypothetical protein
MSRFVLFTKTVWDEPPRLRHQMADLIAAAGHEVLFFEKPSPFWATGRERRRVADGIEVVSHQELVHHRLRLTPPLHHLNARAVTASIRRQLRGAHPRPDDVVISFNYDYWFLRRIFPHNQLITVINDDFICVALFGYTTPLLWALERTCRASDRVLTVSVPLQKQLAPYSKPELFLPWADRGYEAPRRSATRNLLLFWGFINRRLHFPEIHAYAEALQVARPDVRLLFVGPVSKPLDADTLREVEALRARPNVEFRPSSRLDELPLDDMLAAYIPYRPFDGEIDAITLSNKALQLLARGLPLLISSMPAMPNFIEASFVSRVDLNDPAAQIDRLRQSFQEQQPAIAHFVGQNGTEARVHQLLGARTDAALHESRIAARS